MDNGFGVSDIVTGRGLGIGGFGYGNGYGMDLSAGNSALAAGAHADGTGLGQTVACNGRAQAAQLDRISDQNTETRRILQGEEIKKEITDFRIQEITNNGQRDVFFAEKLADMAATSAKCCCDTQLLVVKENSETRELINSRALQDTQRDLDRCLQEKQTQTLIAALRPGQTCL